MTGQHYFPTYIAKKKKNFVAASQFINIFFLLLRRLCVANKFCIWLILKKLSLFRHISFSISQVLLWWINYASCQMPYCKGPVLYITRKCSRPREYSCPLGLVSMSYRKINSSFRQIFWYFCMLILWQRFIHRNYQIYHIYISS